MTTGRVSVAVDAERRRWTPRARPVIVCRHVVKRFYRYEHRTRTMREFFIRSVLRRPIHVRHAEFTLTGFDLRVYRGDALALVGGNGAGKSTALRLMAGIYEPTEGQIERFGRIASIIDLGVGFHPELTGLENVAQYGAIMGLSRRQVAARTEEILAFAEIGDFVGEPVKYYSSGMHARLAFATAALCVEPDVLLVDEVLVVGDHAFQQRCLQYLRRFSQAGGTLVMVSHDESLVRELCDRAVWLDQGRVCMNGRTADVLDAYNASSVERALAPAV